MGTGRRGHALAFSGATPAIGTPTSSASTWSRRATGTGQCYLREQGVRNARALAAWIEEHIE
eukprot:6466925-Lingulodinium_polyedra.AAC.1